MQHPVQVQTLPLLYIHLFVINKYSMHIDEIIKNFYNSNYHEPVLSGKNEAYNKAVKAKIDSLSIWETLIFKLKELEIIRGVRNMYSSARPMSAKLSVGIKGDIEIDQSITVVVGFMIHKIGIYYCHDKEKAAVPIVDNYNTVHTHLSYYPFNQRQEIFARNILEQVLLFFPNLSLFNNFYAGVKTRNVFFDTEIVKEMDFFQVAFDDNMHGFF